MNGKTILKKTLPVIIALVVIIVIALVVTVATGNKKNPTISDPDATFVTYKKGDVTVTVTKQEVYDALVDSSTGLSATVTEMVDLIDGNVLGLIKNSEGVTYLEAVKEEDVFDLVAKSVFGATFDEYVHNNEEAFTLEAKKDGKTFEDYLEEQIKEKVSDFVTTLKLSYGLESNENNFVYMENGNFITETVDGETVYKFRVDKNSAAFGYYKLQKAKNDYGKAKFKENYEKDLAAYQQYLKDVEAYKAYSSDYKDWESAKKDYDNASKADRKEMVNPGKKFNSDSPFWHGPYAVEEEPEEVSAPVLVESNFQTIFEEDNYDKYWSVIIPYATKDAAETALLQHGVVIATNANGDYTWFHYGTTDAAALTAEEKTEIEEANYSTKGLTTIITDNAYYKKVVDEEGNVLTSASPAHTGAYELSEDEIKALIVVLYNQFYQANPDKLLVADEDYTVTDGAYVFNTTDKLEYSKNDLSNLGIYSATSVNKFYKYDVSEGATNAFRDTYTYSIVSGSSKYYIYIIAGKEVAQTWDEYLEANEDDYTKTQVYADNVEELLSNKVSVSNTRNYLAELRNDLGLLIYDTRVEKQYMDTFTSDYEATKKKSKTVVASYTVDGTKYEVTADQLFDKLSGKYGVITCIDTYQIDWMLLEATIVNDEGETVLANKYIDYQGYKNAKNGKVSKFKKSNDDEVNELFENVEKYVENTKNNFAAGAYANYGYPASYGWTNFLKDYFSTNYGFEVNNAEDLKLFYIYQQVVSDYSEWIAEVNADVWENVYLVSMAKTLSEYLSMTGVHFLIQVKDLDGDTVDPMYWTAAQVQAAKELYDEILQLVKILPTSEISTEFNNIVSAFDNAPLLVDGAEPNINYTVTASDGTEYNYEFLDYKYHYYRSFTYTIDVSKYKSLGLSVLSESLSITAGTMVKEFEDAVKQIWDSQWVDLIKGDSVDKVVVYDHSYSPDEYKSYGADLEAEVASNYTGTDGYLATQFGYHVYENLHSGDDDYVAFSDLYDAYEDAVKSENERAIELAKDKILDASKEVLKIEDFDTIYALLDNYYGSNKSYVSSQLSKWFGVYSSSSSTLIYGDFTSSSYYQMRVLEAVLANADNFDFNDANKDLFKTSVEFYLESYYSAFSYIGFVHVDKDSVEDLLDAINFLSDYEAYTNNLDTLLTPSHTLEKASMTKAFTQLKEYAKTAYASLTDEEKAELLTKATQAGVN